MASGFRNMSGQDTDDLYDPDVVGDGPSAPGFRRSDGTTLKYAAAKYGTPGASLGMRLSSGVDIGPQWARKGTATYNLPVDGTGYIATQNGVNGSAQLIFAMNSDGTYSIKRSIRGIVSTLASGTWLPAGDSVGNFTCYFSGTQSGVTQTGDCGFNNITNAPAATPLALTTTRTYTADSQTFTTIGANATQDVAVICNYYRLGVLVHQVHVSFHTVATS